MKSELTDKEYAAMLKVRHRLEDDELKFFCPSEIPNFSKFNDKAFLFAPEEHQPSVIFSMEAVLEHHPYCGTVGCIFGWMLHEMDPQQVANPGAALMLAVRERPRLAELFFARSVAARYKINPKQAVEAIDNYLMGISPIWRHV